MNFMWLTVMYFYNHYLPRMTVMYFYNHYLPRMKFMRFVSQCF